MRRCLDDELEERAGAYTSAIRQMQLTRKEFWQLPALNEMPDSDIVMILVRAGIHLKKANNLVANYRRKGSRKINGSSK
jgi:hypothetical protein